MAWPRRRHCRDICLDGAGQSFVQVRGGMWTPKSWGSAALVAQLWLVQNPCGRSRVAQYWGVWARSKVRFAQVGGIATRGTPCGKVHVRLSSGARRL
jgi:hypothetical protein